MRSAASAVSEILADWSVKGQMWMLLQKHALHGLAVTRILVGVAMFGILVTNFADRYVLWGPGSFWAEPLRDSSEFGGLLTIFGTQSPVVFTVLYLLLMGVALAVILGWRTRLATAALAMGMPALVERADLLGNQGDNIARIGLILMVFMTVNAHWALDARRRSRAQERLAAQQVKAGRTGPIRTAGPYGRRLWHGMPVLPDWLSTAVHNTALITLACQIFILYTASALYKVQGDLWQAGTALHYPLSLHEYGVFPSINALVTSHPVLLTLLTYFSVYVQLFFAVGLLHPVSRRLVLIGVILLHGGIAVLMGLPWFSLAMLAFDAIFVSDRTYRILQLWLVRGWKRLPRRQMLEKGEGASAQRGAEPPHAALNR